MVQGRTGFTGLALWILSAQAAQAQDLSATLDVKSLLSGSKPDYSYPQAAPSANAASYNRKPLSLEFASSLFSVDVDDSKRGARSMDISYGRDQDSRVALNYLEKQSANLDNFSRLRFDDRGAWSLRMDYSVVDDVLELYGTSDLGTFDPDTGENFSASRHRMYQLGLQGTLSRLNYGAEYYSAGKDFDRLGKSKGGDPKAGNAGSNFWGKWKLGRWGIKGSLSRSWNNLHEDPEKPRVTKTLGSLTLDYTLSNRPYTRTSLSYSRGIRESVDESRKNRPDSNVIDRLGINVYQTGRAWNASLNSSYDRAQDLTASSSAPSASFTHSLSASFYPTDTLTITPTFGEYRKHYSQFDTRSIIRRASLSLNFAQREKDYSFKLYGAYKANKNRDWYQDTNNLSIDGAFIRNLSRLEGQESSLSLHVGYNRYGDAIYTDNTSDDLAAWFVLRIGQNATRRYVSDNDSTGHGWLD